MKLFDVRFSASDQYWWTVKNRSSSMIKEKYSLITLSTNKKQNQIFKNWQTITRILWHNNIHRRFSLILINLIKYSTNFFKIFYETRVNKCQFSELWYSSKHCNSSFLDFWGSAVSQILNIYKNWWLKKISFIICTQQVLIDCSILTASNLKPFILAKGIKFQHHENGIIDNEM